jgi:hypothetical protein
MARKMKVCLLWWQKKRIPRGFVVEASCNAPSNGC